MTIVMQAISKSQFKAQLLEYLRKVEDEKNPLIITHAGKPVIKVSPYQKNPDEILISLHKSVIKFHNPLEPVGEKDWEGLR